MPNIYSCGACNKEFKAIDDGTAWGVDPGQHVCSGCGVYFPEYEDFCKPCQTYTYEETVCPECGSNRWEISEYGDNEDDEEQEEVPAENDEMHGLILEMDKDGKGKR